MNAILTRCLSFNLLIAVVVMAGVPGFAAADGTQRKAGQKITVYKSPTCGCCQGWADYLVDNGFIVETINTDELSRIKKDNGLTNPKLASCHTALIDGYLVEGHVPANDIWRLISERPAVIGITAPGMPQMSPGMRSIEPKGYDVFTFDSSGQVDVYSRY